jgi:hypothetical protein
MEHLHPYVLTSHVRDSNVWKTPEGIVVKWSRMGDGNVGISEWVRKFAELCPGKALSLEIIVGGQRTHAIHDPKFWEAFPNTPAREFVRFLEIAEKGSPAPHQAPPKEQAVTREREDLEASAEWIHRYFHL